MARRCTSADLKEAVTPAGRSYSRLVASVLRISDKGCTGWATPCKEDEKSLAANHRSCGAMDAKRSTAIESYDTVYGALWLADTERDKEHKKQQRPAEDERERSSDGTCGRGMAGER